MSSQHILSYYDKMNNDGYHNGSLEQNCVNCGINEGVEAKAYVARQQDSTVSTFSKENSDPDAFVTPIQFDANTDDNWARTKNTVITEAREISDPDGFII